MDDLLLFTPTKTSHFDKLEDLLKALHKKWIENIPKEAPTNCSTWVTPSL